MDILNTAKELIDIEANEIKNLSNKLTDDFIKSIKVIYGSKGKLILSGMGKSGLIAKKMAATFASTGTPSFFLHPGEAYHGDLGMIEKDDTLLLISSSGETDEVLKLIPFLKVQGNITISMSGNPKSTLATNTNYHIDISIDNEGCPLSLAPMSSTTSTLVMGDAMAACLMKLRNFKDSNFAMFHPGGSLGKRLLTTIQDVMKKDNLPICKPKTSIKDIINIITNGKYGLVVVMKKGKIKGIITDGDIRRTMQTKESMFFSLKAKDIMSKEPKTIGQNEKIIVASDFMNKVKINSLLVVEQDELVGIVQMYDLGL